MPLKDLETLIDKNVLYSIFLMSSIFFLLSKMMNVKKATET